MWPSRKVLCFGIFSFLCFGLAAQSTQEPAEDPSFSQDYLDPLTYTSPLFGYSERSYDKDHDLIKGLSGFVLGAGGLTLGIVSLYGGVTSLDSQIDPGLVGLSVLGGITGSLFAALGTSLLHDLFTETPKKEALILSE